MLESWDYAEYYNAFEVVLWAGFAIGIGSQVKNATEPLLKRRLNTLALVFVIFSASDAIEITTGAWWRPWWLGVVKAACVFYFLYSGVSWIRERNRAATPRSKVRISQSEMHWFPMLCFFKGDTKLECSHYLFRESEQLFGVQNLAANLVELTENEPPLDIEEDLRLRDIFSKLWELYRDRKILVVEIALTDSTNFDYEVGYTDELRPDLLSSFTEDRFGFSVGMRKCGTDNLLYTTNFNSHKMTYYQVVVSRHFLANRSKELSAELEKRFNPAWYVDTQVAMMLLGATFTGYNNDRADIPYSDELRTRVLAILKLELTSLPSSTLESASHTVAQMVVNVTPTSQMIDFFSDIISKNPSTDEVFLSHSLANKMVLLRRNT